MPTIFPSISLIPTIGETVIRDRGPLSSLDWLRQTRIGDEQFVLVWGSDGERFQAGIHRWCHVVMDCVL